MFFVMGGRWVGGSFSVGFKLSFFLFKLKWFGGGLDWGCLIWFEFLVVRICCWVFFIVCFLFCRLLFVFCSLCKEKVIGFLFICFCLKFIVDWCLFKVGVGLDFMFFMLDLLLFGCCLEDFNNILYIFFKDSGCGLSCVEVFFFVWIELEFDRFNDVFCSILCCFKSLLWLFWVFFI